MSDQPKAEPPVKTAATMFRILETLQARDGASVSGVANELGMARSTAHRHLRTLYENEFVVKHGDTYQIGLRFLRYGEYARCRNPAFRMAKDEVKKLSHETGERAQFIQEEHGAAVPVYRERGSKAVQKDLGIGKRVPIYATASGKAILAHLPKPRVEEIIETHGFEQVTSNTITDREMLLEELATIQERGYSTNIEEYLEGLHAVGTAIRGRDGQVFGSISISGPAHRLQGEYFESELPDRLLGSTNELELNLAPR